MGNFKAVYRILPALEKAMDLPGFDVQQIGHEALGATHEALVPVHGDDGRRRVHHGRGDSAVHHRRDLVGRAGYNRCVYRWGEPERPSRPIVSQYITEAQERMSFQQPQKGADKRGAVAI